MHGKIWLAFRAVDILFPMHIHANSSTSFIPVDSSENSHTTQGIHNLRDSLGWYTPFVREKTMMMNAWNDDECMEW